MVKGMHGYMVCFAINGAILAPYQLTHTFHHISHLVLTHPLTVDHAQAATLESQLIESTQKREQQALELQHCKALLKNTVNDNEEEEFDHQGQEEEARGGDGGPKPEGTTHNGPCNSTALHSGKTAPYNAKTTTKRASLQKQLEVLQLDNASLTGQVHELKEALHEAAQHAQQLRIQV